MKVLSIIATSVITKLKKKVLWRSTLAIDMKVSHILVISVTIKLQHRVIWRNTSRRSTCEYQEKYDLFHVHVTVKLSHLVKVWAFVRGWPSCSAEFWQTESSGCVSVSPDRPGAYSPSVFMGGIKLKVNFGFFRPKGESWYLWCLTHISHLINESYHITHWAKVPAH